MNIDPPFDRQLDEVVYHIVNDTGLLGIADELHRCGVIADPPGARIALLDPEMIHGTLIDRRPCRLDTPEDRTAGVRPFELSHGFHLANLDVCNQMGLGEPRQGGGRLIRADAGDFGDDTWCVSGSVAELGAPPAISGNHQGKITMGLDTGCQELVGEVHAGDPALPTE